MANRSKLDEIEDYNFAISQFIHNGKSMYDVTEMLKKRGAESQEIKTIFETIHTNLEGVQLIEKSRNIRVINFLIDTSIITSLSYFTFSLFRKDVTPFYLSIICVLIHFTYYVIFESFSAQTPGKLITNTIVSDLNGKKPSFFKILIRTASRLIYYILLGPFIFLVSKRLVHDYLTATYVVDKKRWAVLHDVK